jgi:hypothetical protein
MMTRRFRPDFQYQQKYSESTTELAENGSAKFADQNPHYMLDLTRQGWDVAKH